MSKLIQSPQPYKPAPQPSVSTPPTPAPLLSARHLRRVQSHQEEFAGALAARLSGVLRAELSLSLAAVQLTSYQSMTEGWPEPAHLALFKTEPLRGVSILRIPSTLGWPMLDRLMGGSGQAGVNFREMGAIEHALLEQAALLITSEWCRHWPQAKDLKPVLLGCESNARFLQTAPAQAQMLVVSLDTGLDDVRDQIQLAFPHATIEPLLATLSPAPEMETPAPLPSSAPAPAVPRVWNSCFDDVAIPVTGAWQGLKVAARQVLNLKVGDVVRVDPAVANQIEIRLAGHYKFRGRPGMVAGNWAVELTEVVKR